MTRKISDILVTVAAGRYQRLERLWGSQGLPIDPEYLSSSFLGIPYRIVNIDHKKELLRGLWGRV